jgi:glycerol kinase
MREYIGALDQGTTSTRFIVFDRSGRILSAAQREHQRIYPRPGGVEHDPDEVWLRTQQVIAEAMQAKNLRQSDLVAIGITNQRETTVVWDRNTGVPRLQRDCVAGHSRGRRRCGIGARRWPGSFPPENRPAPCNLISGP